MAKSRMCQELVEIIAKHNPNCPIFRHCKLFAHSCSIPNRIDLDEEYLCSSCQDPEGTLRECYCEVINQAKGKKK